MRMRCVAVVTIGVALGMMGIGVGTAAAQAAGQAEAVRSSAAAADAAHATAADAAPSGGQQPAPVPPPQPVPPPPSPAGQAGTAPRVPVNEKVTFKEAIDRALARNPTIAQAAADILRADALIRQARATFLPQVTGGLTTTTVHPVVKFDAGETDATASPRNQLALTATAESLLIAPVEWALRNQARDNKVVAERARDEVRRQIALSTALAYIAILTQQRLADTAVRARDTARSHYDLAFQQQEKGAGSKLNALRAQQAFSTDEAAVEDALFAAYQAQEALGVLLAADGPVDAAEEPALDLPPTPDTPEQRVGERADIRLAVARELAAQRVVNDSWKEYLPTVSGVLTPQYLRPETLFSPDWSLRAQVLLSVPIFDSGLRGARKAEREALLSRTQLEGVELRRQAASEIRTSAEAVRSAERSLVAARAGADQAQQVVEIVNVAFRAGATTNIEVIDAQRVARDADTDAALTEDRLRRARLELLVASGRFPQ